MKLFISTIELAIKLSALLTFSIELATDLVLVAKEDFD